jgi:hypothetical protein
MSRSFIKLRRVVFGVSCAVVFGFGATQAAASPERAGPAPKECHWEVGMYCQQNCASQGLYGRCQEEDGFPVCRCF